VKRLINAPTPRRPAPATTIVPTRATRPRVRRCGSRGRNAPTAKLRNEATAAARGEASGVETQLLAGQRVEATLGIADDASSERFGLSRIETLGAVDERQLADLLLRHLAHFLSLQGELVL
jgi:hypothetical protein